MEAADQLNLYADARKINNDLITMPYAQAQR